MRRGNEGRRDGLREREGRILLHHTFFMKWSIHQYLPGCELLSYSRACLFPEVN